jgi:hypothetical protein
VSRERSVSKGFRGFGSKSGSGSSPMGVKSTQPAIWIAVDTAHAATVLAITKTIATTRGVKWQIARVPMIGYSWSLVGSPRANSHPVFR